MSEAHDDDYVPLDKSQMHPEAPPKADVLAEVKGRDWWPEQLVEDELLFAEGRAHPDRWIERVGDDYVILDDDDEEIAKLTEGSIHSFSFYERFAAIDVELRPDGTYEIVGGSLPPHANQFYIDEPEDACFSLLDVIDNYRDGEKIDRPEIVSISVGYWSDAVLTAFTKEGGKPRFVLSADVCERAIAAGSDTTTPPPPETQQLPFEGW